jgi:hypothetical protein
VTSFEIHKLLLLWKNLGKGEYKNFTFEERDVPVCCDQNICGFFV